MPRKQRSIALPALLLGALLGTAIGYLVADSLEEPPEATGKDHSAEIAEIRAELAELKVSTGSAEVDGQVARLEDIVTDILLRGDEFALRADYARTADRLDGHTAGDFALSDADEDGTPDGQQLRDALAAMRTGKTPVAQAVQAETAGSAETLGNLSSADFALADHSHALLDGNVRCRDDLEVEGALSVSGNIEVFGNVLAAGGIQAGVVDGGAGVANAGVIRYDRRLGVLQFSNGVEWLELATVEIP